MAQAVTDLDASASWETFLSLQRGPPDLAPSVGSLPHPAAHLLKHLRVHGAPIPVTTGPWSQVHRDRAAQRGSHKSAKDHTSFVRAEFVDFLHKKFWTILPYRRVQALPNLRLSPLGVVPQRERRPRLIVDLSYSRVNQECLPVAPSEAMQFGRTLQRLLQRLLAADPVLGPVFLSKIDIADGFYRIQLAPRDSWRVIAP